MLKFLKNDPQKLFKNKLAKASYKKYFKKFVWKDNISLSNMKSKRKSKGITVDPSDQ